MKTLTAFIVLTLSSVYALADTTTIRCHDLRTNELLATVSSERTFKAPLSLGLFEVARGAKGTMTLSESGATVPVSVHASEGLVLEIRIREKTGLIVNASGAGYILEDGKHKSDIYCDGYESKKWPTLSAE